MADHLFGAIELALVFGVVLAWGVWELLATGRARRESERREAATKREDRDNSGPRA